MGVQKKVMVTGAETVGRKECCGKINDENSITKLKNRVREMVP